MNEFENKTAINPVTNQKPNPDDRVGTLDALRRKTSQLIKANPIALRDINQEAIDAAIDASVDDAIDDAIEAGLDVQAWVSFRCTPEQKVILKSACHDRGIAVSDWVKARVFDLPLPQPRRVKLPYATMQNAIALNRIGVNLNQLMRKLKQDEFVEETILMQCISETQALLQQILIELSNTENDDR